jgi:hypothetical protein
MSIQLKFTKTKYLALLFCLHCSFALAQQVTIKEIKCLPDKKHYNTTDATLIYPIVLTKNTAAGKLINAFIKAVIIEKETEDSAASVKQGLKNMAANGTINLSYEVTFNKNNLLSLYIFQEGCGAHCSSWNTYFNFDSKTGKAITIEDIITKNSIDGFRKKVLADKQKALTAYKEEEKEELNSKAIDSSEYDWAMREVDEYCINSIDLSGFSLSATSIAIMDACEFPNAIKSQSPSYNLSYLYTTLSGVLQPALKNCLLPSTKQRQ